MPETRNRYKVGTTRWTAEITRLIPGEFETRHVTLETTDRATRADAQRWVQGHLAGWSNYDVIAQIRTGTWVSLDYTDDTYGTIWDAEYEEADTPRAYCQIINGTVDIEWEE